MSARSFLAFPQPFGASALNVAHLILARLGGVGRSYLWFGGGSHSSLADPESDLGAIRFAPPANGH